jgi:hypothetical protein
VTRIFKRPRMTGGALAIVSVLACASCGSSPAPDYSALAKKVVAVINSTNTKLSLDRHLETHLSFISTANDLNGAAGQLQALHFPSSMQQDLASLVTALHATASAATQAAADFASGNIPAQRNDQIRESNDDKKVVKAYNALRHDLGLPPAPTK